MATATTAPRARAPGSTLLADGSTVSKCDPRLAAIGDLEETRCAVDLLAALLQSAGGRAPAVLHEIGQDLGAFAQELGTPGRARAGRDRVAFLDRAIADGVRIEAGNAVCAAQARVCRAVSRRAERTVVDLAQSQVIGQALQPYLDRLADLMQGLADRIENQPARKHP